MPIIVLTLILVVALQVWSCIPYPKPEEMWKVNARETKKRYDRMDNLVKSHLKNKLCEVDMNFSEYLEVTCIGMYYFMYDIHALDDFVIDDTSLLSKADYLFDKLVKSRYIEIKCTPLARSLYPDHRKTVRSTLFIKKEKK